MAFSMTFTRATPAGPPDVLGEPVAGGDAEAQEYGNGTLATGLASGVDLIRRLRPGWWLIDYSWSNSSGGGFVVGWKLTDATALGDAATGSTDTVYTPWTSYFPDPYVAGSGSGSAIIKAASEVHPCAQLQFRLATSEMIYEFLASTGAPLVEITGTWLACAQCEEPV
jgi:hypothetical protein